MTHEPFDTLAPIYAVGALDGDDLVRFEAHLRAGCEVCESYLRDTAETFMELGRDEPPAIPPAHVRDTLLRRVEASARPRPARRRWVRWAVGTAAAAVAAAVFTSGMVAARYEARLGHMAREIAQAREALRREQATLR